MILHLILWHNDKAPSLLGYVPDKEGPNLSIERGQEIGKIWGPVCSMGPRITEYFGARQQYRGQVECMVGPKKNVRKI